MKEKFKKLPVALKRQIIHRTLAGVAALLVFILILVFAGDFMLSLPCLLLSVYFIISGTMMFFNCIAGKYVVVRGVCTEIERTALRKRIKAFCVSTEDGNWKIVPQRKIKGLAVGSDITVYLPSKTRVYDEKGAMLVFGIYAYEINSHNSAKSI